MPSKRKRLESKPQSVSRKKRKGLGALLSSDRKKKKDQSVPQEPSKKKQEAQVNEDSPPRSTFDFSF